MPQYFPVMLNCEGRKCVIVGGGHVAERKAESLLNSGANVVVISPELTAGLKASYEQGILDWIQRNYINGDLQGAFLVYAATDAHYVNAAVVNEAESLGILVNHTGDGGEGSFISPSVLRKGSLVISVSTSGAGPAVARQLCREIEERYGDEYEEYIDFLTFARSVIKREIMEPKIRRRALKLLAESDILTQIREGRFVKWNEEQVISWINEQVEV